MSEPYKAGTNDGVYKAGVIEINGVTYPTRTYREVLIGKPGIHVVTERNLKADGSGNWVHWLTVAEA